MQRFEYRYPLGWHFLRQKGHSALFLRKCCQPEHCFRISWINYAAPRVSLASVGKKKIHLRLADSVSVLRGETQADLAQITSQCTFWCVRSFRIQLFYSCIWRCVREAEKPPQPHCFLIWQLVLSNIIYSLSIVCSFKLSLHYQPPPHNDCKAMSLLWIKVKPMMKHLIQVCLTCYAYCSCVQPQIHLCTEEQWH